MPDNTLSWHIPLQSIMWIDQIIRSAEGYNIHRLAKGDDYGLYLIGGMRNDFGTSLICRGPLASVRNAVRA